MNVSTTFVTVTRLGAAVSGSPFSVKLRYRRLHVDPQIAPIAARRPVQEFLLFDDIAATAAVGDLVTFPDGELCKIVDVRSYPSSLQCILQRLPYAEASLWLPCSAESQIGADKSLSDLVYTASGTVRVLLEPHGPDQPGPLPVGKIDRRTCWVFSLQQLSALSVLVVAGERWLMTATSSVWPLSGDYRGPARLLAQPPIGVS